MDWTCGSCTFINEVARTHCAICDAKKPFSSSAPEVGNNLMLGQGQPEALASAEDNTDLEAALGSPPVQSLEQNKQKKDKNEAKESKTEEKTSTGMVQQLASMLYSQIVRYKMVLVVRTDLKMGKGKIAAQCCHGCLGVFEIASARHPSEVHQWRLTGAKKVVLKCKSEEELLALHSKAKDLRIPCYLVQDAGRTQIARGSKTVLALGPLQASKIDPVTKDLKLL